MLFDRTGRLYRYRYPLRIPTSARGESCITNLRFCTTLRITGICHRSCCTMYHKRPFMIPLALDMERRKGKRDPGGVGIVPVIRVLSCPARMISGYTQWASAVTGRVSRPGVTPQGVKGPAVRGHL